MVSSAKDLEEERNGLESRLETKQLGMVWQARLAQGLFVEYGVEHSLASVHSSKPSMCSKHSTTP